ncbi:MAG: thiamine phosphate synthase [Nitrosomonadales bacterium]|nr:thiamine phosphate synthase [Nitrosomonadales bacterium]
MSHFNPTPTLTFPLKWRGLFQQAISGLYAITPDEPDTAELLRKVRLALLGGARVLQYRNKIADAELRLKQAEALRELTREFAVALIVNDDIVLAKQVAADGAHLGGADGSVAAARALLGSGKIIGVSCYNRLALAHEAVRQGADYVAFGSFFSSSVKPDAVAATLDLLRQARRELTVPLVAIGGITAQNGAQLLEAGADALAVISAVFAAPDIEGAAREFSNLFEQGKPA